MSREYSKAYCAWLLGVTDKIYLELCHLHEQEVLDDMCYFKELDTCTEYIKDYDDGDYDINLPGFIATVKDFADEFGIAWNPVYPASLTRKNTKDLWLPTDEMKSCKQLVQGVIVEYGSNKYIFDGYCQQPNYRTFDFRSLDKSLNSMRISIDDTISNRPILNLCRRNPDYIVPCNTSNPCVEIELPKATRVYAKTVPNPDYVQPNYMLLL